MRRKLNQRDPIMRRVVAMIGILIAVIGITVMLALVYPTISSSPAQTATAIYFRNMTIVPLPAVTSEWDIRIIRATQTALALPFTSIPAPTVTTAILIPLPTHEGTS